MKPRRIPALKEAAMQAEGRTEGEAQTVWLIDPAHTTVEFTIKNLFFFDTKGRFSSLAGKHVLDESDIRRSSVTAAINAASIDSGNKRRDAHLRSADYLDVDRYPEIRFESTKVELGGDRDTLRVTGSLTIKEKSREVMLEVNEIDRSCSPNGEQIVYYTAQAELDRFDFEIKHARALIGRKLKIFISVQAGRESKLAAQNVFRGASA
jgi:polyisoprenoid-binding protein YceI